MSWSVVVVIVAGAGVAHAQEQAAASISIEDALRAADQVADGLVAAKARVGGAEQQITAAKSAYYPQLNASASYGFTIATEFGGFDLSGLIPNYADVLCDDGMTSNAPTNDPGNFFCSADVQDYYDQIKERASGGGGSSLPFGQRNTWRVGASASQQIYDGGRTRANVAAAKVGVALAKLSVQQIRAATVYGVSAAYYGAVLAQRQVEIVEASLASAEATFADAQLKNTNGAIAEFDVVRSEVARDNERNALVQAQANRDSAHLKVKRLIGVPLDRPITLSSTLDLGDPADVDGVIADARAAAGLAPAGKHLAIIQAELNVVVSQHQRAVAAADRLPQVTAVSDFGLVDYGTHPFNTDWKTNWSVGVNVSFPIFDGFRRRALVRKAEADVAAARARLDDTARHAGLDAAQADTQIAAAIATWQSSGRTVTQAKRAYQIAELRFGQGASTQLELVDARFQLNQAELNQARSAHDLRVARLRRELLEGLPLASGF